MKLSLVLIIYRSNSSSAEEASIFCKNALKARNIKSKRIDSDFDKNQLERYFCNLASLPEVVIVLGGDGTVLKSANALVNYDIPLLSFNIGGNLGFLTQEKDFLFDKSFIEILEKEEFVIDFRNRLHCDVYRYENHKEFHLLGVSPKDWNATLFGDNCVTDRMCKLNMEELYFHLLILKKLIRGFYMKEFFLKLIIRRMYLRLLFFQ